MPEAVKEGVGTTDVAVPEDAVPPAVDLATDGAVEVKPPPATEPSLPVDQIQEKGDDVKMQEVGETAPEVREPPTEQSVADKSEPVPESEAKNESKTLEPNSKEELEELILKGRGLLAIKRDHYAAAEVLSKACELSSQIYGELSENCGELYYLYGCSMLECGKHENNVLGETMKDKDKEDEAPDEEEEEDSESKEGKEEEEAMEVDEESEEGSSAVAGTSSNGAITTEGDEGTGDVTKDDNDEDEDSSLKVAWEMFELAKVVYTRLENTEKLADTFMKLGEVGIESGHPSAMDEMIKALDIRDKLFPNSRVIPETHFNIGLGYSMFEMFDEAITHFEKSKSLLEEIAINLEKVGDDQSLKEVKEIKEILPDLKDKIQDMLDSKREKRRDLEVAIKNGLSSEPKENGTLPAGTSSQSDKPASNISHLIKRKRKIDEVTSDLPSKAVEPKKVKAFDKEVEEQSSNNEVVASSVTANADSINKSESTHEEPMETEELQKTSDDNSASVEKLESTSADDNRQESDKPDTSKVQDDVSKVIALQTEVDKSKSEQSSEENVAEEQKVKCESNKLDVNTSSTKVDEKKTKEILGSSRDDKADSSAVGSTVRKEVIETDVPSGDIKDVDLKEEESLTAVPSSVVSHSEQKMEEDVERKLKEEKEEAVSIENSNSAKTVTTDTETSTNRSNKEELEVVNILANNESVISEIKTELSSETVAEPVVKEVTKESKDLQTTESLEMDISSAVDSTSKNVSSEMEIENAKTGTEPDELIKVSTNVVDKQAKTEDMKTEESKVVDTNKHTKSKSAHDEDDKKAATAIIPAEETAPGTPVESEATSVEKDGEKTDGTSLQKEAKREDMDVSEVKSEPEAASNEVKSSSEMSVINETDHPKEEKPSEQTEVQDTNKSSADKELPPKIPESGDNTNNCEKSEEVTLSNEKTDSASGAVSDSLNCTDETSAPDAAPLNNSAETKTVTNGCEEKASPSKCEEQDKPPEGKTTNLESVITKEAVKEGTGENTSVSAD